MPRLPSLLRLPSKLRPRARRRRMATLICVALVLFLVVTPLSLIYKPPGWLIGRFVRWWPDVLWRVPLPADRRMVALTIDDAPSEHTREILAILRENDAKATFFVIGGQVSGAAERQKILEEIVAEGHELANHGMHDEAARALTDAELEAQIEEVQTYLREAYKANDLDGPPYNYYRPGSGFFNKHMRKLLDRLGYRLVLGSIYPHDAQISWWRANARHILSMLRPGGIIICHDRRSWTPPMLRKMLPEAKRRGYQFRTVTQVLQAAGL